jgi:Protein of unknown function (DUF2591)
MILMKQQGKNMANEKMVKVEIATLSGIELDWVAAQAVGAEIESIMTTRSGKKYINVWTVCSLTGEREHSCSWNPSTDPAQGAPIIFDSGILSGPSPFPGAEFAAGIGSEWDTATHIHLGRTQLEAGLRCFSASKLGETVEIPAQLLASVDADANDTTESIGEKHVG